MADYIGMKKEELQDILATLNEKYNDFLSQKLKLDMSRGKPSKEQLDLSMEMLDYPSSKDSCKTLDGTDCRNYGLVDGIPEAKALFAEMLEVSPKEIIIGGNASLSLMYDSIARAMMFGVFGGTAPWSKLPVVKFLCPSPGYDRHFAITELFKFEMITIDMKQDGPDMDKIEELVSKDETIKGIWCTPKYSNPEGITYSDDVVRRLASMKTKAADFRIFWDNAYTVHHLTDNHDKLLNIMSACNEAGNPDRVYIFSSTSKITFPGAGIAVMAASENNINLIKKQLGIRTIGPDKINQLRHVAFLKDMKGIEAQMKKHAAILKPKFDMVLDILQSELGGKNIAWWNKPKGGYFISFNTLPGCAKESVEMALKAGVVMTPAGATYPYGKDPQDRNIRIAPTLPPVSELKKAMELLCICVQIASIKKLLQQ
jgi:Transcriptional regulators containing a DNA-binding HTH domain and an aminotransferase domain (MocR family) and their eukaryotic orthologs